MAAFELGHPMPLQVVMKTDDLPPHTLTVFE
jgi:hypothetical protein